MPDMHRSGWIGRDEFNLQLAPAAEIASAILRAQIKHLLDHLCSRTGGKMKIDEASHATMALSHGGAELPAPVKVVMKLGSKIMTKTAYWV